MGILKKGGSKSKEDFENPHIPEDFYQGTLDEVALYQKPNDDGDDYYKVRINVEIPEKEVSIPYFAPANFSITKGDGMNSDLANQLINLDLEETAAKVVEEIVGEEGIEEQLINGKVKFEVEEEDDEKLFKEFLVTLLDQKKVRVLVADMNDGESSLISKFSDYEVIEEQ